MSSEVKLQTIDGYISEYATTHKVSPMQAIQTQTARQFIEYADERDTSIYVEENENKEMKK